MTRMADGEFRSNTCGVNIVRGTNRMRKYCSEKCLQKAKHIRLYQKPKKPCKLCRIKLAESNRLYCCKWHGYLWRTYGYEY